MYEPEREVLEILKRNNIDVVTTLPCEKICLLLQLAAHDQALCHVGLNREENGVGLSAGAFLAGGKPLMLIQSTGLGNLINAIMSLTVTYGLPLPIIASWRGVHEENIEAQVPFGRALPKLLDALELKYTIIESSSQIGLVEEAIQDAFSNERPHIALISPRAWFGDITIEEDTTVPHQKKPRKFVYEREFKAPEMSRYDAIRIISEYLTEEAVIANIGVPSKELYAAKDRDLNFYMLGSLGQASPIGFGVSLKTQRETMVLDGDGSLLMSNFLPIVAEKQPETLSIVCLDNGTWGSTGDQPAPYMDMELMALSAGIENTMKVNTEAELRSTLEHLYEKTGPRFLHVVVKPGNATVENIPLRASQIKRRFIAAMRHAL
ncbi:MAG TPA: sulfopyruvate decarboxylase subunit alpha [Candidatus Bathyarchaeia archaeon]|nr:sulfopyruvate decarboxylase subunit alpha [Candidatus Bathyarchaeia archaeon]